MWNLSSPTKINPCILCTGKQSSNHCGTTREVLQLSLLWKVSLTRLQSWREDWSVMIINDSHYSAEQGEGVVAHGIHSSTGFLLLRSDLGGNLLAWQKAGADSTTWGCPEEVPSGSYSMWPDYSTFSSVLWAIQDASKKNFNCFLAKIHFCFLKPRNPR